MREVWGKADRCILWGHRHKSKEESKSLRAGGARALGEAEV